MQQMSYDERATEIERLKQDVVAKEAAIQVLMEKQESYRKGLAAMANSHVDDYRAACENAQRTWQGLEHDFYVTMRKLFEREWKRAARIILGDEYDCTASPHHFPKHEDE